MKRIIAIATALLLTVLFVFSAVAVTTVHYEFYMTMFIPDGFEEYENEDSLISTYINTDSGSQINIINIASKMNYSDIDYGNLSSSDIYSIEKSADTVFISEGSSAFFTYEPQATEVYVNSNKGVKIHAQYIDPSISSKEVYATVYYFSTESYIYNIGFMSYSSGTAWYEECLDSLIVGKGSLGTEATNDDTQTTKYVSNSSKSETGPADFFEGIGTLCGIAFIIYLIYRLFSKRK